MQTHATSGPRISVVIPCINEEIAVPGVTGEFRCVRPSASIDARARREVKMLHYLTKAASHP